MNSLRTTLVLCLMLVAGGLGAWDALAASFDCAKAGTKVENIICNNWEISKLDVDLAVRYKASLEDQTKAESIKQAQKRWLKERNACSDAECVKRAYETRLTQLSISDGGSVKHSGQDVRPTDDYVLDPEPKEMIDWNWEEYKKPEDKGVCSIYLQNLQYFARRSEPLSCGQPIAPTVQDKIKPAEWENLDPDQYPDLFKAAIKEAFHFGREEPAEGEIKWRKKEVKERAMVFRRLKFGLTGSPGAEEGSNQPLPEQGLNVIQIGSDVTRSDNPDLIRRCQLMQGRKMHDTYHIPELLVASEDLKLIYYKLWDWRARFGQNLWFINKRIYGEYYDEKADVKLTELRNADYSKKLVLEPVCLFHFKQATNQ